MPGSLWILQKLGWTCVPMPSIDYTAFGIELDSITEESELADFQFVVQGWTAEANKADKEYILVPMPHEATAPSEKLKSNITFFEPILKNCEPEDKSPPREIKPVERTRILSEATRRFMEELAKLYSHRPANQMPPTLPDPVPQAVTVEAKPKSFEHLKPVIENSLRDVANFKKLLAQIAPKTTQETQALEEDHFSAEGKLLVMTVDEMVYGDAAPMAPPLLWVQETDHFTTPALATQEIPLKDDVSPVSPTRVLSI